MRVSSSLAACGYGKGKLQLSKQERGFGGILLVTEGTIGREAQRKPVLVGAPSQRLSIQELFAITKSLYLNPPLFEVFHDPHCCAYPL